ncbi:polyketide cyclase [Rhodococcoides trifolii]|uniref:Polyketide cyclase n=1 Tax=Rhodococcoides trifolii TaxID=908250 RepID=A0A917FSY3_9NOCA|nr:SRPBCC family protein [Rhodococcus trifolii]GGF98892.1 polyketide cyclase [Rhodococcus trifolii]
MTSYEHSDSITIAASPADVYALVSDVTRTGEWSPICEACWWTEGDGGVGSTFTGRNVTPDRTWETVSTVEAAEPGKRFGWAVAGGVVHWAYILEPADGGSTTLTESWSFPDEGVEYFHSKYGEDAQKEIDNRVAAAHDGIPRTLAAIKRVAES